MFFSSKPKGSDVGCLLIINVKNGYDGNINVYIGQETSFDDLKDFTIITYKQKRMGNVPSRNLVSLFQFAFTLSNKVFNEPMNMPETYFIIYILDNDRKKALYKSQEFYFNNISSNIINLDNEWLMVNGDPSTPIYVAIFCPHLRQKKPVGYGEFSLRLMEYNLSIDQITNIGLKSSKYGKSL